MTSMRVTRHFVDVGTRRVHFRRCGSGPALLMVHQSPRSSAELEPLMQRWATHFSCIAPDTPGFGHSDPLTADITDLGDFADAIVALLDALGIARIAAYGFHSGGIILVTALRRHPTRFSALAVGGYAVWTLEERASFAASYLPALRPTAYGEHLTWLWNRVLEQTWFFPWYAARSETRLSLATDDPTVSHEVVRDLLDSDDAYRAGYGAVLQATCDIPPPSAETPPVMIAAFDGDPLQAHLERLEVLPGNWQAVAVTTRDALEALFLTHLSSHARDELPNMPEAVGAGFVYVLTSGFSGRLHWRGERGSQRLRLHGPGRDAGLLDGDGALLIDLPGHGLSDPWQTTASTELGDWAAILQAAIEGIGERPTVIEGEGTCALLAAEVARRLGARGWTAFDAHVPATADTDRWLAQAIPDMVPDRFGGYLTRGWSAVRAAHFFWPWFAASLLNARDFNPAEVDPDQLAREHRALVRASAASSLLRALLTADRASIVAHAPPLERWSVAPWASKRGDMWRPTMARGG